MQKNLNDYLQIQKEKIDFQKIYHIDKVKLENNVIVEFIGMTYTGSYGYKEKPNCRITYTWNIGDDYMIRWGRNKEKRIKILKILQK